MSEAHINDVFKEILAERKQMKSLPILATRYSVIETHVHGVDGNGNYISPDPHRVSPYFGTEKEALDWIKEHKRTGYNLSISTQYLREFTEQRWSSF